MFNFEPRILLPRDEAVERITARVRRPAPRYASAPAVIAGPRGGYRAAGGNLGEDVISQFQNLAEQCLPPAVQKRQNQCGPDGTAGGNMCNRQTRRVPIGGSNLVAVAAGGAFLVTINVTAGFFPVLIGIPPTVAGVVLAGNLIITAINYGPVAKMIGSQVTGGSFDYSNDTGGYILEGGEWLTAGQTIVLSGTSKVAFAVGDLSIDVHGLTNSPG